jgi:hypothetical protein
MPRETHTRQALERGRPYLPAAMISLLPPRSRYLEPEKDGMLRVSLQWGCGA